MAADRGEDIQSRSMNKLHDKSGVCGPVLREMNLINMRKPKDEIQCPENLGAPPQGSSSIKAESGRKRSMEEDDETTGTQEKHKMRNKVCPVCNKAFSSGKAVGGHMRIHVQANKDSSSVRRKKVNQRIKFKKRQREDEGISAALFVKKKHHNKKLICLICGKNFPSMKSLCGHMRCHPERNWRGIQPPTMAIKNSLSKIEPEYAERNQASESFRGWSVTVKRGRNASVPSSEFSSLEDDRLRDAVLDLMTLARGDSFESGLTDRQRVNESEGTNSNSLTIKSDNGDTNPVSESKNQIEEKCSTKFKGSTIWHRCLIGAEKGKSVGVGRQYTNHNQLEDAKMAIKNKKRKKKVRLSDLEFRKYASPAASVDQNLVEIPACEPPHDKYRCITCGKCFQTHQALGGHRSSHNKHRTVIHNPTDQSSFAASEDEELSSPLPLVDDESTHKCQRTLDFDLNEQPPLDDETGTEV